MAALELSIFLGSLIALALAVSLWMSQRGHMALAWQLLIAGFLFYVLAEAVRLSAHLGFTVGLVEQALELPAIGLILAGLIVQLRATGRS